MCTCTYAVNMTNPYAKIARQSEGTWALFHKRVSSMQLDYSELFTDEVYSFLENMAKSIGSSIGYLLPSILTSTAFALGSHGAQLMVGTHLQPINLFTIFIGHPGTGKSPAIEKIINLLRENTEISREILISRSTSSGLVKLLAKHGKAFVCSPEIYDFLIKLLKNDDETASGDIQLLCKLFSGEPAFYHFATESARDIEQNTPFCLLGATQLQNAAKIVYRMDQGHGLLDRFLVAIPLALRPTPEELDDAQRRLDEMAFNDFQPLFDAIFVAHTNIIRVYKLDDQCVTIHRDLQRDFAAEVNEEILHGNMPPKSKKTEIIPRVAVCLSVLQILLLTFKAIYGHAPGYLTDLITIKVQSRYTLRSASGLTLNYPSVKLKKTLGDRAFSSAAPTLWNSLPLHIRLVDNFERFKSVLKTHLFKLAFDM